ncbi:MAG: hypothetical protein NQU46_08045 [Methanolinea sp.]|nr:hypothetical protein [Methanolinea sp.]
MIILLTIVGILFILNGYPPDISLPVTVPPSDIILPESPPSLQPGPTQTVPPGTEVQVQVHKDPSNGEISFLFSGGPGQKVLRSIEVEVIRQDGTSLKGTLRPIILEEVILQGTRGGTDRVQVRVSYLSGSTYTIIDRQLGIRD